MTVVKVFTLDKQETFDFEDTTPKIVSPALRQTLLIGNLHGTCGRKMCADTWR